MILGKNGFFVNPSDSLAIITANYKYIKYLNEQGIKGVSRYDMMYDEAISNQGIDF